MVVGKVAHANADAVAADVCVGNATVYEHAVHRCDVSCPRTDRLQMGKISSLKTANEQLEA